LIKAHTLITHLKDIKAHKENLDICQVSLSEAKKSLQPASQRQVYQLK
jgi:hypothetical protein